MYISTQVMLIQSLEADRHANDQYDSKTSSPETFVSLWQQKEKKC
jgi:hypothetical protein